MSSPGLIEESILFFGVFFYPELFLWFGVNRKKKSNIYPIVENLNPSSCILILLLMGGDSNHYSSLPWCSLDIPQGQKSVRITQNTLLFERKTLLVLIFPALTKQGWQLCHFNQSVNPSPGTWHWHNHRVTPDWSEIIWCCHQWHHIQSHRPAAHLPMPTGLLASNPAGISFVDGWIFVFGASRGKETTWLYEWQETALKERKSSLAVTKKCEWMTIQLKVAIYV